VSETRRDPGEQYSLVDAAWQIARAIADEDKQLLSSRAVHAFAKLAAIAQQNAARRSAEIASAKSNEMRRIGSLVGTAVAEEIRIAISAEFGLAEGRGGGKREEEA
jgi:hypothetical protein